MSGTCPRCGKWSDDLATAYFYLPASVATTIVHESWACWECRTYSARSMWPRATRWGTSAVLGRIVLALILLAATAPAANWRTIRRATLSIACSSMAADAYTTMGPRRIELTPWLRRPDGHPAMGRIWALKAGACGGLAVVQEAWPWRNDKAWTAANVGTAAGLGWVAWRNTRR